MRHSFQIQGMKCEGCTARLKSALERVRGVVAADVSFNPPIATVEMEYHVEVSRLNDAVASEGAYRLIELKAGNPLGAGEEAGQVTSTVDQDLSPLAVVLSYILGGVLLRAWWTEDYSWHSLMQNFMGGFFVVFSLFKMINLKGFADGYSTYDIVAKRSRAYALAFPFIELGLGIAYLTGFWPLVTNLVTFALMGVGSVGVAKALRERRSIQCACLGTALKLPMTKVTLGEDVVMGLMALGMIASQMF
jgi:copper chaperone CopZ